MIHNLGDLLHPHDVELEGGVVIIQSLVDAFLWGTTFPGSG